MVPKLPSYAKVAPQISRALCPERVRSKLFDVSGVMFYNVQSARPLYVLSSFFDWCALWPMSMCNCFLAASSVPPSWLLGASPVHPWCILAPLDLVPGSILDLQVRNLSLPMPVWDPKVCNLSHLRTNLHQLWTNLSQLKMNFG